MTENISRKRSWLKWLIIALAIILALLLIALMAVPPMIMANMIRGPILFDTVYTADEYNLETVTHQLETRDGLGITAYEVAAANPKAVIIFLSGIHNPSVTAFFGHAAYFLDYDYAAFLIEMRAHGSSEGERIELGYSEIYDVEAAVLHIQSDESYSGLPVIVYGLSMGGATAINAAGQIEGIDGLVSLSAYSSWPDVFTDNMIQMGAPAFYTAMQKPFVRLYLGLLFGFSTWDHVPVHNIALLEERPALIMHSSADSQIPFASFERLQSKAPDHVETWVRSGDYHFMADAEHFLNPAQDPEYIEVVLNFLENHFAVQSDDACCTG